MHAQSTLVVQAQGQWAPTGEGRRARAGRGARTFLEILRKFLYGGGLFYLI